MMMSRSIRRFNSVWVGLAVALSAILASPAPTDVSKTQVAGHLILKAYTRRNGPPESLFPNTMFQDRSGLYWIASTSGLATYDDKRDLWKRLTGKAGALAPNDIEMIAQSLDGRLWFVPNGSSPGPNVSSFDGDHWVKIDKRVEHPSLKGRVSAMFSGKSGKLWFALEDQLVAYDGDHWTLPLRLSESLEEQHEAPVSARLPLVLLGLEKPNPDMQRGLKEYARQKQLAVQSGIQDSEGVIWLGTLGGIIRFDERKHEWKACLEAALPSFVRCIYEDRRGRIWFGDNRSHLCVFDKKNGSWSTYDLVDHWPLDFRHDLAKLPDGGWLLGIKSIYQDRLGRLMFGTREGLFTYDEDRDQWAFLSPENSGLPSRILTYIMEDQSGRIWVGTGEGIIVLEP